MNEDEDSFLKYHQTRKLYIRMKHYYSDKITIDTPFKMVQKHIKDALFGKFKDKNEFKVLYLSLRYLDEIGYPLRNPGCVSEWPIEPDLN